MAKPFKAQSFLTLMEAENVASKKGNPKEIIIVYNITTSTFDVREGYNNFVLPYDIIKALYLYSLKRTLKKI